MNLVPIRKLVVGAITYGVVLGARKALHVHLSSDTVAETVNGLVGFAAAYAVRDPRVRTAATEAEYVLATIEAHPELVSEVSALAQEAVSHRVELDRALAVLAGATTPAPVEPVPPVAPTA